MSDESKRQRYSINEEYERAKKLGFKATTKSAMEGNPYMLLKGGTCLVWLSGGKIMLTDSAVHFGPKKLYLRTWYSDKKSGPHATVSSTQKIYENGMLQRRNENYYRVAASEMIEAIAKCRNIETREVELDHINRMRGDNRMVNLRPADAEQNNRNRGPLKIENAFFTEADVYSKLASGEWVPEEAA